MTLSKPIKVITGMATGVYAIFPLIFIPVWFLAFYSAILGANARGDPPPIFFFALFSMFPLICLFNLLHFVLLPLYIIHIIKNKIGDDLYRILAGIGLLFFPWLAMPAYFLLYMWPEKPPDWALSKADSGAQNPSNNEPELTNESQSEQKASAPAGKARRKRANKASENPKLKSDHTPSEDTIMRPSPSPGDANDES